MKTILTVLFAALMTLPACTSSRQPERYEQVMKEAPDAKPALYVSADDERFVGEGMEGRQIHLYSKEKNRTYVVDEKSGKVLRTFDARTPKILIVDKRSAQPMEMGIEEEGCGAILEEACGCGCAPEACGCAPEAEACGCGCAPEACGCGDDAEDDDACGDEDEDEDDEDDDEDDDD